ncbi:hypothetical protein E2C01_056868 [Portunus trituberculatus]|uniref:Uncharacterized protein n=1 Tax=Portunus trituberculatus TaxID=210409 RepID=A0A5B7H0R4_PORTR|nr:hypothetical protein [Portunus trituberculatus]
MKSKTASQGEPGLGKARAAHVWCCCRVEARRPHRASHSHLGEHTGFSWTKPLHAAAAHTVTKPAVLPGIPPLRPPQPTSPLRHYTLLSHLDLTRTAPHGTARTATLQCSLNPPAPPVSHGAATLQDLHRHALHSAPPLESRPSQGSSTACLLIQQCGHARYATKIEHLPP